MGIEKEGKGENRKRGEQKWGGMKRKGIGGEENGREGE